MMEIKKNNFFYKIYQLSTPELWLDLFLPILLGAAISLNLNSQFKLLYFLITAAAFLTFIISANSWIKYFFKISENFQKESNLYQLVYYFYFNSKKKKHKNKSINIGNKTLIHTAIITTLLLIIFSVLSIRINQYLLILILTSILLFMIYIYLQIKMIDSFFDELIIGLLSGPLLISISYLIQSGSYDISVIIISLPISLFVINLRWVSQHNRKYSYKGFKVLLLFIYASYAVIFAIFNNILFLFLYISLPIVMYKVNKNKKILYYNSNFNLINFSRKFYYYNAVLLAALLVIDYIIRI